MKKYLSFLLTSILFFSSSILLYSQDENYDAVYLQLKKEYTLNPDGSMDYRYMKKLKLQSYRSFISLYGETFVPYNPDFQSLKINEAYTIMADGKKNPSPANAFNEVLPSFAANAPAYNNLREMVITHSGTERNAVINLDYLLHTNKGYYPCMAGNEVLSETEPLKDLTIVIRVPFGVKLNFSILNCKENPVITLENGFQVYTLHFTNVPAMSTEDFQLGGNDLYPRIIFSTAENRYTLYTDFTKQNAFSYELNDEMKQFVATVAKQNPERLAIILKLQEKVVNDFRLYPIPLRYTGFTCRTAQQTWNSNGGTPIEKAVLLCALLKEYGENESGPGLLTHGSVYDESIGLMFDVEDAFVRVKMDPINWILLSVSSLNSQDLELNSPGRGMVILDRPTISQCKEQNDVTGQIKFLGNFTITDKKQINGHFTCIETLNVNPYLTLSREREKAKSLFGGGLSPADLKDPITITTSKKESSVSYTVEIEKPFIKDSDYYFLKLPIILNGIESLGIHLLPKNRATPLEINSKIEESDDFTYVLPEKMNPFLPKEKLELKNAIGEFSFEVKTENHKIFIHKYINLYKRIIQPDEYPYFKALMDHWNTERYRELVLRKTD